MIRCSDGSRAPSVTVCKHLAADALGLEYVTLPTGSEAGHDMLCTTCVTKFFQAGGLGDGSFIGVCMFCAGNIKRQNRRSRQSLPGLKKLRQLWREVYDEVFSSSIGGEGREP